MLLNDSQKRALEDVFMRNGLDLNEFDIREYYPDKDFCPEQLNYVHKLKSEIAFSIRYSLMRGKLVDVYCSPYPARNCRFQDETPSIYQNCQTFQQVLELAEIWAKVTKYRLQGKEFIHKVFISHSSKDAPLLDLFVKDILQRSCGLTEKEIIYTSKVETGVTPEQENQKPVLMKWGLLGMAILLY